MAIDIQKPHNKSLDEAQAIARDLVEDLAQRFGVDYCWQDNHLHFERMGVSGNIEVNEEMIRVTAELNFLIAYLEPQVVDEVNRYLDEHF